LEYIDNQLRLAVEQGKGFVLDGSPRTVEFAKNLDDLLVKNKMGINAIIELEPQNIELLIDRVKQNNELFLSQDAINNAGETQPKEINTAAVRKKN